MKVTWDARAEIDLHNLRPDENSEVYLASTSLFFEVLSFTLMNSSYELGQ